MFYEITLKKPAKKCMVEQMENPAEVKTSLTVVQSKAVLKLPHIYSFNFTFYSMLSTHSCSQC